jgi:hypothetical protein
MFLRFGTQMPFSQEPPHVQQSRFNFISARWAQLNGLTKEWGDKAVRYLMLTNAGGAVAVLSFMASDKVREMVGPKIALSCFALGVIVTGILVAKQLHRVERIFKDYRKDSTRYLIDQIEWLALTIDDDNRAQPTFWDYFWGYAAFALFIGGCVAGGISLFR